MILALRDAITVWVSKHFDVLERALEQLPNRYADPRTIHRAHALDAVREARPLLKQQLDSEIVNRAAEYDALVNALREARDAFVGLTRYDHTEAHLDHDDLSPVECPLCIELRARVARWDALLPMGARS